MLSPSAVFAAAATSNTWPSPNPAGTWITIAFAQQTGIFSVRYDVVPYSGSVDLITALCSVSNPTYSDCACIVRFADNGIVDARNGANYEAVSVLNYSSHVYYHVRMEVSVSDHTYSAYVTPAGGAEVTIANNYAFRTEANTVTDLDFFTRENDLADSWVLNFALSASMTRSPTAAQLVITRFAPSAFLSNRNITLASVDLVISTTAPLVTRSGGDTQAPSAPTGLTATQAS